MRVVEKAAGPRQKTAWPCATVILLVAGHLALGAVPTPESHFGHRIGADRTVLDWDKVVSYFQALEKSSPRIRVADLGRTGEGRPFIAATIADEKTIRNLDRYFAIQQKLADPRRTPEAEAEKLIAEGKTVVMITCSIHSTELASTHTAVQFAYNLLTEDKPRYRAILANTIFILVPSLNPDGVDIVTQWYRKTLGTPYEGTSPPRLYNKYTGHDDNRDWYIFSQAETRLTVSKLHNVWHPQIVYDVHQQTAYASRIFIPPWLDPLDPNIDPILAQECNMIGAAMASDLTAAGKPGVVINALYDFWSPARHYQAYHGGLRILSESASARLASPITIEPGEISRSGLGYNPRQASWNYLEPWMGGEWHLGDIIDYQLLALESCLYQAAIHREEMLRAFYRIGQRAISRKSPYAFVIPGAQFDPGSAARLLETLDFGQVEIERAAGAFQAGSKQYPAASYVIRMEQPYSSFAKTLLERQKYPDLRLYPGGPPKRPYDVTAQTLPLLMGVQVDTVETPFTVALERAHGFKLALDRSLPPGALAASDVSSWRTLNQAWDSGRTVWRDTATGDFYLERPAAADVKELKRPRVGLYRSFMPEMDEGWTRWLLDEFRFKYTSLGNAAIKAGNLREHYDVVLFPSQSERSISSGYRSGSMPEEYLGGLGEKGAEALKQFAADGGTLIFLNDSTDYASDALGLKMKNVIGDLDTTDFYSPGSLLNVTLDTRSPLAYGLPSAIAIWSEGSPAWQAEPAVTVARYPQSGILASGWLLGEKHLAGQSALVRIPLGKGHAVLFGMRPQYRAQSYQGFKILFNALVD